MLVSEQTSVCSSEIQQSIHLALLIIFLAPHSQPFFTHTDMLIIPLPQSKHSPHQHPPITSQNPSSPTNHTAPYFFVFSRPATGGLDMFTKLAHFRSSLNNLLVKCTTSHRDTLHDQHVFNSARLLVSKKGMHVPADHVTWRHITWLSPQNGPSVRVENIH